MMLLTPSLLICSFADKQQLLGPDVNTLIKMTQDRLYIHFI